jgi:hypothetical protein
MSSLSIKVYLPGSTSKSVLIDSTTVAQDLVLSMCSKFDIANTEEWGLSVEATALSTFSFFFAFSFFGAFTLINSFDACVWIFF